MYLCVVNIDMEDDIQGLEYIQKYVYLEIGNIILIT